MRVFKFPKAWAFLGVALLATPFSWGQAPAARLAVCGACHGAQGIAPMPRTPHLAGQDQDYLLEQLRHYRSGKRQHEVMSVIAKSLTDSDLESITYWFSSQRIVIEKAP